MKGILLLLVLLVVSVLANLSCGPSGGGVTGECPVLSLDEISNNAGVLPADSCWLVESNFILSRPLSIEEGVVIQFAQNVEFAVDSQGELKALGSADKPVKFTGVESTSGFWKGISIGSDNPGNILDHVIVEYAGSKKFTGAAHTLGAIFVDDTQIKITNSELRENKGAAFIFVGENLNYTFENNKVAKNEIAGILNPEHVGIMAETNTWTENVNTLVVGYGRGDTLSTSQTWKDVGTPLMLVNDLKIKADLVLAPNVMIIADENIKIKIEKGASLNAVGNLENPITFKGKEATKGYWQGIEFQSKSAKNILEHAVIQHAGGGPWHGAEWSAGSIYIRDDAKLLMTHSEISESESAALLADSDADLEGFSKNKIIDNQAGLYIRPAQVTQLAGDTHYSNNVESYIFVFSNRKVSGLESITKYSNWKKSMVPFRVDTPIKIEADLFVDPGVVIEFTEFGRFEVLSSGALKAEGTSDMKVVFKGAENVRGFWKGIKVTSKSLNNRFNHVIFSDAGKEKWTGEADTEASLFIQGDFIFENTEIKNGAGYAIILDGNISECENVTLMDNTKGKQKVIKGMSACM